MPSDDHTPVLPTSRWLLTVLILCVFCAASLARVTTEPTTQTSKGADVAVAKVDSGPTLVSGKLKKVSAPEMFSKLADQAHIGLVPADDGVFDDPAMQSAVFSTEWDKQPLWDALREACESANVHPIADGRDEGMTQLRLARGPWQAPMAIDGIAVVRVREIVRDATISFGEHAHQEDRVRVALQVLIEPKARGWAWIGQPTITHAQDEKGRALPATRPAGEEGRGSRYGNGSGSVAALLDYAPGTGQRIARLTGTIPIQVADSVATVTFHNPLEHPGAERFADVGGNRLILKGFVSDASGCRANLFLNRGPKQNDELWTVAAEPFGRFGIRALLIGPKGTTKQTGGSAGWDSKQGHTELYFPQRADDDPPTDLQVQLPASFAPVMVKFEFKDLPMP